MKIRALNIIDIIRSSFWFIPASMSLTSAAFLSVRIDYRQQFPWTGWVWSGGHEGAREVLSVIASSMITVADPHMLEAAFQQIRNYGKASPVVLLRLMKLWNHCMGSLVRLEDKEAVPLHATATMKAADNSPSVR